MKKIEAIIRQTKFDLVKNALQKEGYTALTTFEVKGRGKQSGIHQMINGKQIYVDLLPKTMLIMIVNNEDVDKVLEIIIKNAQTGDIGDGKIFITDIEEAIRVRTGEKGKDVV